MPRDKGTGLVSFHASGTYETIRSKELRTAMRPDPRLLLGDLPPDERAALETQRFAPTAIGQVQQLLNREPVSAPAWYFGRSFPEARDWLKDHREVTWVLVWPDDTIMPGGGGNGGCPSERTVKRAAHRARAR
jgi:hypothetical protein